eukprot:gene445-1086_t
MQGKKSLTLNITNEIVISHGKSDGFVNGQTVEGKKTKLEDEPSPVQQSSGTMQKKMDMMMSQNQSTTAKPISTKISKLQAERKEKHNNQTETCHFDKKKYGPLLVDTSKLDLAKLHKSELSFVQSGGQWKPENCLPRTELAVVIPFRNREAHLAIFLRHMHKFLKAQKLKYRIFVIEQDDDYEFNRGKLMNVGFKEALKRHPFKCFAFHDIDLLPEDGRNDYGCPSSPRHLSVAVDKFDYELIYPELFGGVEMFKTEDYKKANGFSNSFWGWGGEDDNLYYRVTQFTNVTRPAIQVARYKMLKHVNMEGAADDRRFEILRMSKNQEYTKSDGLSSLQYKVMRQLDLPLFTQIKGNQRKQRDPEYGNLIIDDECYCNARLKSLFAARRIAATMTKAFQQFQFFDEEGRQKIYQWSEKRRRKYRGFTGFLQFMKIFAFDKSLMKSFLHNVNIIVLIQMVLSDLYFEVHVTLFVSPLVFPLAFSINTDFQRREKVLEDLANFKASIMVWFFCVRDWRVSADFSEDFMKSAFNRAKGLMFHLREYLLTEKKMKRDFIVRVLYEDLSDVAQINEKIRVSKLPTNAPIIARNFVPAFACSNKITDPEIISNRTVVQRANLICLSFERLRVIREYRSPRSIRSFTKVFIFALPLLLAPYYVHLGRKVNNNWCPYFIAVLVTFLFGALQGVQDKLDDPFDGMSEDDIDLETLDEWTVHSLEATANRTTKVGRFTVSVFGKGKVEFTEPTAVNERKSFIKRDDSTSGNRSNSRKKLGLLPWQRQLSQLYSDEETSGDTDDFKEMHPYKDILSNLPGNATIVRGGHVKEHRSNFEELNSSSNSSVNPGTSVLDPTLFQLHTPGGSLQRSVDKPTPSSSARKLHFNNVFFDRDADPESIENIRDSDQQQIFGQRYDVPKTLQSLFPPQPGQVAIQLEPLNRNNSMPLTGFVPYEGQVPRLRKLNHDRSESLGMIPHAHPGVGVASYINAMNKEKMRKTSACSLRGMCESGAHDNELASVSGEEGTGTSVVPQKQLAGKKRFNIQKAKPLSLTPIVPNVKDDDKDIPDEKQQQQQHKLSYSSPDESEVINFARPKYSSLKNRSTSKTKLLGDTKQEETSFGETRSPNFDVTKQSTDDEGWKMKFSIKKSESDSCLMLKDAEDGSSDSLSQVVGKLKDKQVFL